MTSADIASFKMRHRLLSWLFHGLSQREFFMSLLAPLCCYQQSKLSYKELFEFCYEELSSGASDMFRGSPVCGYFLVQLWTVLLVLYRYARGMFSSVSKFTFGFFVGGLDISLRVSVASLFSDITVLQTYFLWRSSIRVLSGGRLARSCNSSTEYRELTLRHERMMRRSRRRSFSKCAGEACVV